MSFLPGMFPGGAITSAAPSPAATIAFVAATNSSANNTTYTFASHSIGTAAADRYVGVAVATLDANNTGDIALWGVTIGGIAATLVAQKNVSTGGDNWGLAGVAILLVPAGTTATIAVTFSEPSNSCQIAVYQINGLLNAGAATDTLETSGDPTTGDITVEAGGVVLAAAMSEGASTPTHTWTNLTEGSDAVLESPRSATSAYSAVATAQTVTITCDPSVTAPGALAASSFR